MPPTAPPSTPPALPEPLLRRLRAAILDQRAGRLDAAISGYRAVLRQRPELAEAANNLGVALKARGKTASAVKAFEAALRARPGYVAAHANLATSLLLLDRRQAALKHAMEAARLDPTNPAQREILARVLGPIRFSEAAEPVLSAMEALFTAEDIEHQPLVPAALSLLRLRPGVSSLLESGAETAPADTVARALDTPLLCLALERAILADPEFEAVLEALRRRALEALTGAGQDPFAELLESRAAVFAALGCHAMTGGFPFAETPEERALLSVLDPRVAAGETSAVLVWALYRPLWQREEVGRFLRPGALPKELAPLLRRQVAEPLEERELGPRITCLTPVEAAVSQAVRQQYENHPYPRWLTVRRRRPEPLSQVVAGLFPWIGRSADPRPLRVLIAGCGTGKHAVEVATRYADAQVLAVDLSLTSLAFATRRAGELGIENLRFAQADLLSLDSLGESFDLIESVGVLHHLGDPEAGWRVLKGLLAPEGLMRIGLYSRRGRPGIRAARAYLQEQGFASDDEGLRAARRHILDLAPDHPAAAAARELDFYSLSGCRDLLFHVQERDYELSEVAETIGRLGLEFLGFEFPSDAAAKAYEKRFPGTRALNDLAKWERLETEKPGLFHHMYQFWCRPRGAEGKAGRGGYPRRKSLAAKPKAR